MSGQITFLQGDIEKFAEGSHDFSPLHCDALYARKTIYGEPVVHGILGILECLKTVKEPIKFLEASFLKPMFCGVPYTVSEKGIFDANTKVAKLKLKFAESDTVAPSPKKTNSPQTLSDKQAKDLSVADILEKKIFEGEYSPNSNDGNLLTSVMMWSSWFIGMEVPGRQALYSKISLTLHNDEGVGAFSYKVTIREYHSEYNLLSMSFECSANGNVFASGDLEAFIRPKIGLSVYQKTNLPCELRDRFDGKTALITGASRGFGAALAQVMAAMGAHVIINFNSSAAEARKLQKTIQEQGGSAELWQCDVSKMQDEGRDIDILVLNAAPSALTLNLNLNTVSRIERYVSKAFSYALVPLAAFAEAVNKNEGYCLVVSSAYLDSMEPGFPHYLCSKGAVETLGTYAGKMYKNTKYVTVRPPKMLTDMSNSVIGNINSQDPITVAEQACMRLLA